jgi:hypothetical protein
VLFFSDHAILKKGFCKVKRNIVSITIEWYQKCIHNISVNQEMAIVTV